MTNLAATLGRCVRRAICPVLAHDWRFRDIAADGRCTAYCRFCGKCEPARLLLRSPPAAAVPPSALAAAPPAAPNVAGNPARERELAA